jgi:flagellar basal body-associated protein FliL
MVPAFLVFVVQENLEAAAAAPAAPSYKGRCTIVLLTIAVVLLAVGVGVYVSTTFATMHPLQEWICPTLPQQLIPWLVKMSPELLL